MEYLRILNSNDLNRFDEYVNNHGVNKMVNGASLLFWAVYGNKPSIVKRLLESGADPNLNDENGRSPLEIGAYYGFYETCKTLLEKGAKIDEGCFRRSKNGWDGFKQDEIIELLKDWQDKG